MPDFGYTAAAVAVMALVTAGLRFAPFLLLGGRRTPRLVVYLGRVFPCATVGLLAVYGLNSVSFAAAGGFVPPLLAAALVEAPHPAGQRGRHGILYGTGADGVLSACRLAQPAQSGYTRHKYIPVGGTADEGRRFSF